MRIIEGFRLRNVLGQATIIGEGINQVNFNKIITLNSSAEFLWKEIEGKDFNIEMLACLLVNKYGIDIAHARDDAKSIAEKWIESGLVRD